MNPALVLRQRQINVISFRLACEFHFNLPACLPPHLGQQNFDLLLFDFSAILITQDLQMNPHFSHAIPDTALFPHDLQTLPVGGPSNAFISFPIIPILLLSEISRKSY
jgi:hypothetical protein